MAVPTTVGERGRGRERWLAIGSAVSGTAARLPSIGVVRTARRVPGWALDWAPAAGFLAAMLIERAKSAPLPEGRLALAVTLNVAIAGGLALRRTTPLAAYLLGTLALVSESLWALHDAVAPYANMIGIYSLGLYASRARAWSGPALIVPAVLVYFAGSGADPQPPEGVLLAWLLAWAVGYGSARRREQQQAARHAMRRETVADERSRLARELHDLVGHTVNVMVVQAGAARLVLERDQAKAREILAGLESTGRQALTELDLMLGVLRRDSLSPESRTPPNDEDPTALTMPGIADLPRLAQRMTEAGLDVRLRIQPPSERLARSIDLSAYRIVQEALTNAMKHGGARSASVAVGLDERALIIEVCDDGHGAPAGYLPGRGLLGIAERASAFGGGLQHGPGEQGGFRLRAVLRVPEAMTP